MSHAGNSLGLPELEVERVDRNDAITVYARPKKRPPCLYCQHPRIRIKETYERTLKHTRQGNQVMTLHLMHRHEWNLKDEQRESLAKCLDDYPVLKALYTAKQQLNRLLLLKSLNRKKVTQLLPQLLSLIEGLAASPLHRLARTLKSWLEPIVDMWRFTKTNCITEGFHNTMEMLSRRAYGFRNFENYRLRVLGSSSLTGDTGDH